MNDDLQTQPNHKTRSLAERMDIPGYRRAIAGTKRARRADGGVPTRLPSGEWMLREAIDLPEAMLNALEERAGGDKARMGELVRAALVAAGIGAHDHVAGIRDGSHADDSMDDDQEIGIEVTGSP
jgi:uncharacterized protein (DUF3820 family)